MTNFESLLLTDEQRRTEHRPTTLPELRSAARHLTDGGYTPRDVSAALAISEAAVISLLEGQTQTP